MNDRELLELAAKAAGFYVCNDLDHLGLKEWGPGLWVKSEKFGSYELWNPLADDGDALRLAACLRISLLCAENHTACDIPNTDDYMWEDDTDAAAARRAIVRSAAAIGAAL